MEILLISNSTNAGEEYLAHCIDSISDFLETRKKAVFIPFAAVTFSYDDYENKVKEKFARINQDVVSIHKFKDYKKALKEAEAIVVGGGNSFVLMQELLENDLMSIIKEKVQKGTPYIGWSAGSNVACPTIRTTNDMPIVEPQSFNSIGLIDFQINPHYLDANPEGHAGETREQRLEEFLVKNQNIYVVGLREGTMLEIKGKEIKLIGKRNARIFKYGIEPKELSPNDDFSFLI